jgi:hypothetical protein
LEVSWWWSLFLVRTWPLPSTPANPLSAGLPARTSSDTLSYGHGLTGAGVWQGLRMAIQPCMTDEVYGPHLLCRTDLAMADKRGQYTLIPWLLSPGQGIIAPGAAMEAATDSTSSPRVPLPTLHTDRPLAAGTVEESLNAYSKSGRDGPVVLLDMHEYRMVIRDIRRQGYCDYYDDVRLGRVQVVSRGKRLIKPIRQSVALQQNHLAHLMPHEVSFAGRAPPPFSASPNQGTILLTDVRRLEIFPPCKARGMEQAAVFSLVPSPQVSGEDSKMVMREGRVWDTEREDKKEWCSSGRA